MRRVTVEAEPPARVADLDGKELGTTPQALDLVSDAPPRVLVLSARGYEPRGVEVSGTSPERIMVRLTPSAAPKPKLVTTRDRPPPDKPPEKRLDQKPPHGPEPW
jgi:hypothetical protein